MGMCLHVSVVFSFVCSVCVYVAMCTEKAHPCMW